MKNLPTSAQHYLIGLFSSKQSLILKLLIFAWIGCLIIFWSWWFNPDKITTPLRFAIATLIQAWFTLIPGYYYFFLSKAKKPNPIFQVPNYWRIAMVVTKAPSEPWPMVKKTLLAMTNQSIPHDNWLADENPTPEVIKWCNQHNIKISTRFQNPQYHQDTWPRRKKCKEGNLAYFYDHFGYQAYDFVAQLDADHIPDTDYLYQILIPFNDPAVGYVSAPSICDNNAKFSWSARGRLYAEATFHGTLQAGYSNGWAPLCIGSHYAVRTSALKQIGGLGPELAEDHSTTLIMNSAGWKGVHALDATAHGDGPATFTDCMTQEFQWSRSLAILLVSETPKHLPCLPLKLKIEFLFAQIWYLLFGTSLFIAYLMPILALLTFTSWVNVSYIEYLLYSTPMTIISILIVSLVKHWKLLKPTNAKVLSWEATLFQLARWPWVLYGVTSGLIGGITRKQFSFKVTPKGKGDIQPISFSVLTPYLMITSISALTAIFVNSAGAANGYYYFTLINAFSYLVLVLIKVCLHYHEYHTSKQ